jgi:hypothetical protein
MSLLYAYSGLMESVSWRARGAVNENNEPTYADTTISVIWYDDIRIIRNAQGEELQQYAFIQTASTIQQGDMITRGGYSWPIIGLQKTPTFEGEQFRIGNLGQRMI